MAVNTQTVLTPLQTSSKAVMAALVFAPQRPLICDLTLGASGPHTVGRSAGASSVLDVCQKGLSPGFDRSRLLHGCEQTCWWYCDSELCRNREEGKEKCRLGGEHIYQQSSGFVFAVEIEKIGRCKLNESLTKV